MVTLSTEDALLLVRRNLDEAEPNGSVMYSDEANDNMSLDDIILKFLPEAINDIHRLAPVRLLEGKSFEAIDDLDSAELSTDGILSFTLKADSDFMRLVAFQAADSAIVVSDILAEASPEGRKQLNPHIRGRKDRPRLIQVQGDHTGPAFKYYTLDSDGDSFASYRATPASAIARLVWIQEKFYDAATTEYYISRRLRQNIIDCLTAKVMETYSDQRAQSFYQKANNYSNI